MRPRQAGSPHVKARAACVDANIYGLVTIAALVSIVGIVMCWSTMVEKKLVSRPDARNIVPDGWTP